MPRALAENSGVKGNELISKLYAVHHEGNKNMGFDIEVWTPVLGIQIRQIGRASCRERV